MVSYLLQLGMSYQGKVFKNKKVCGQHGSNLYKGSFKLEWETPVSGYYSIVQCLSVHMFTTASFPLLRERLKKLQVITPAD